MILSLPLSADVDKSQLLEEIGPRRRLSLGDEVKWYVPNKTSDEAQQASKDVIQAILDAHSSQKDTLLAIAVAPNSKRLLDELAQAGAVNPGIFLPDVYPGTVRVHHDNPADQVLLQQAVTDHVPELLSEVKGKAFERIDRKTTGLISQGFRYQTKTFSLSPSAQRTYNGLARRKGSWVYPVVLNTLDDLDTLVLASEAEVQAFDDAAAGAVRAALDSGTALKGYVRAAKTLAEVAVVQDSR